MSWPRYPTRQQIRWERDEQIARMKGYAIVGALNDEHIIHSLIGTTARTLRHVVEERRRG
jgi:hypothetical protein